MCIRDRGISVRKDGEGLIVDLHIIVSYGVNISAICQSIVNKVRYTVEEATGCLLYTSLEIGVRRSVEHADLVRMIYEARGIKIAVGACGRDCLLYTSRCV